MHLKTLFTSAFLISLLIATTILQADPVSLNTGETSTVSATVTVVSLVQPADDPSNIVSSLPYTTPVSASNENENVTTTPNLTTSDLAINVTENSFDVGSSTEGSFQLFFIAGPNVQFTIGGTATDTNPDGTQYYISLFDQSTSINIYNEGLSGSTTLTFDDTYAPLTGPLTAGDEYEFYGDAILSGPPETAISPSNSAAPLVDLGYTFNGNFDLTFTQVPEPSAAAVLLVLSGARLLRPVRRRQHELFNSAH